MIRLAFYKGRGNWWDTVVRWATWSKYSHVEVVIPGGMCISSSPRDGGVRAKQIDFKPGHWDFVEVRVSLTPGALAHVPYDAKYDWLGAVCTILCPFRAERRKRWFCSELAAQLVGAPRPWRMTPQRLFDWAKRRLHDEAN